MPHFYPLNSWYDSYANIFLRSWVGQLMVVMFLFYSGFGVMESYKHKPDYFKTFPTNRILKTYLHFALTLFLYIILNLILQNKYSIGTILLSFTAYESIGSSNWFIFCIVIMYIITYIGQFIFKNKLFLTLFVMIMTFGYIFILWPHNAPYWYNTALTYSIGMLYSCYREKIEGFVTKNNIVYSIVTILSTAIMVVLGILAENDWKEMIYSLHAIFFAITMVLYSYKINLNSPVLEFFGKHSFSIYILQRLSMMVFAKTAIVNHSILFTVLVFATTIPICILYDYCFDKFDKLLFKRKPKTT